MRPAIIRVNSVRIETAGSPLAESITTASPLEGDSIRVEAYTDFFSGGGDAVIEPDTPNEEVISYSGIDIATDRLLGVIRPNPKSHQAGVFVQSGTEPLRERLVDGYVDGDETQIAVGLPARADVAPYLALGTREADTSDTVWAAPVGDEDEDDDPYIISPPVGAAPLFDEDLLVLPAVGGGDASLGQLQPDGTIKLPPGMGFEDGKPPEFQVIPEAIGGIGNTIFVTFTTGSNTSTVKYKLHGIDEATRAERDGEEWEPTEDTLIETQDLAGTPDFFATFIVKEFPATHVLIGAPDPGTNYFFKIVPSDGAGDAEGPYPEAGPVTPLKVIGEQIADATIDLATHVTGLLPEANFEGITDPAKLADAIVTAAKLATGAVTNQKLADLAVTGSKIEAATITGAKIAGGTITGSLIAADAIAATHLAAGSVIAGKIAANAVTAGTIAAGAVVADKIAASAVVADKIAAGAVTAGKINVDQLSAISANLGTITAGTISGVAVTGNFFEVLHGGSHVGSLFSAPGGFSIRGTGLLDNLHIRSDRTGVNWPIDFLLTTQSGKTGLDQYIPIYVNGTARFLRVFN